MSAGELFIVVMLVVLSVIQAFGIVHNIDKQTEEIIQACVEVKK